MTKLILDTKAFNAKIAAKGMDERTFITEAARFCGVSPTYMAYVVRGKTPSRAVCTLLAQFLGCQMEEIAMLIPKAMRKAS